MRNRNGGGVGPVVWVETVSSQLAKVRVRVRVRAGEYVSQSEPRWGRVWNSWGDARRDVYRDPPKPAVHRNTKNP